MIRVKFESAANAPVGIYRRLLLAEWGSDFPDRVINLLWRCLRRTATDGDALNDLLDPKQKTHFPTELFTSVLANIAVGSKFLRVAGLPKLPLEYHAPAKIGETLWQTYRTIAYLTLQANVRLTGSGGLFLDAQALAFQSAVHVILPKLNDDHAVERSILLHGLALFAAGYFSVDPAHSTYMTSALYGAIGDAERRLQLLHESFRFTSPDDHSFLTKAQEYWMELLDLDRRQQVKEFLASLAWRSRPEHQEEVGAMMTEAFSHIASLAN